MLTPPQISDTVKRVQQLDDDCRNDLLFALIGRMSIELDDALLAEVDTIEEQHERYLREDDEHRSKFPPRKATVVVSDDYSRIREVRR